MTSTPSGGESNELLQAADAAQHSLARLERTLDERAEVPLSDAEIAAVQAVLDAVRRVGEAIGGFVLDTPPEAVAGGSAARDDWDVAEAPDMDSGGGIGDW